MGKDDHLFSVLFLSFFYPLLSVFYPFPILFLSFLDRIWRRWIQGCLRILSSIKIFLVKMWRRVFFCFGLSRTDFWITLNLRETWEIDSIWINVSVDEKKNVWTPRKKNIQRTTDSERWKECSTTEANHKKEFLTNAKRNVHCEGWTPK